jgi:hypothetical protein
LISGFLLRAADGDHPGDYTNELLAELTRQQEVLHNLLREEIQRGNLEQLLLDLGDIEARIDLDFRRCIDPDWEVDEPSVERGLQKIHIRLRGVGGAGSLLVRGFQQSPRTALMLLRYYIMKQCKAIAVLEVAYKRLGKDFDGTIYIQNMDAQERLFCSEEDKDPEVPAPTQKPCQKKCKKDKDSAIAVSGHAFIIIAMRFVFLFIDCWLAS